MDIVARKFLDLNAKDAMADVIKEAQEKITAVDSQMIDKFPEMLKSTSPANLDKGIE